MVMDEDIRKLAISLKSSGVAASMMEAMQKAKEILVNSEKTLDSMKKYTEETYYKKKSEQNDSELSLVNRQINEINSEIAQGEKAMQKGKLDLKRVDKYLELDESMIPYSKDNLFTSGKTLQELYSEEQNNGAAPTSLAAPADNVAALPAEEADKESLETHQEQIAASPEPLPQGKPEFEEDKPGVEEDTGEINGIVDAIGQDMQGIEERPAQAETPLAGNSLDDPFGQELAESLEAKRIEIEPKNLLRPGDDKNEESL